MKQTRKSFSGRFFAALLTLTMTAGMMTGQPGGVIEARADNTPPDATAYATVAELMEKYDLADATTDKTVQSVYFGQNGSGAAQVWKIAGKDTGVEGSNIVLFAATPLITNQVFQEKDTYDENGQISFTNSNGVTKVNANHYGVSKLRSRLKELKKDTAYFNSAEQGYMNKTEICTEDTFNGSIYSVKDVLYAAYGEAIYPNNTYITVGTNSSGSLNNSLRIDKNNWGLKLIFWLRTPEAGVREVAVAHLWQSCVATADVNFSYHNVVPAFNLNLSSVIFASAAPAASSTSTADMAAQMPDGTPFTLRYAAAGSAIEDSTITFNQAKTEIKTEAIPESGAYLVVQNSEGACSMPVSDKTPGVKASDMKINGKNLTDFAGCKVWLETTVERITYAKNVEENSVSGYTVTITPGSHMTKTSESGAELQADKYGAIEDVVYTADRGYYFPEDYAETSEAGIIVTRDSASRMIVSGAPTKTAYVQLADAEALPTYAVTAATDGHGTATASNATALEGETVTLTATSNTGYKFKEWTGLESVREFVDHTTVTDKLVKFKMPAEAVTATATFEEADTYQLTVHGGIIHGSTGEKRFEEGETPTIKAIVPAEQIFKEWKLDSGDALIASPSNAATTVTIGTEDSVITAVFDYIKDVITRVMDIIIKKEPAKTRYKLTEKFNPAGLVVQAKGVASPSNAEYSYTLSEGGDGYELDSSEFDPTQPGEYEIHVKYDFDNGEEEQHFDKTFTVEVLDEYPDDEETYVSDIKIKTKPVKQTYYVGDEIDLTGLVVIAKQKGIDSGDAKEDQILAADEYDVEYDFSTPGTRKVTILYYDGGKDGDRTCRDTFTVKVLGSSYSDSDSDDSDSSANTTSAGTTSANWIRTITAEGAEIWQYKKDDGTYATNEWIRTVENGKEVWYHFDEESKMQTGWFFDPLDGHFYYLDPASGRMMTGWVLIDDEWYYFNETAPEESGWFYDTEKKAWVYVDKGSQPLGMWIEEAAREG